MAWETNNFEKNDIKRKFNDAFSDFSSPNEFLNGRPERNYQQSLLEKGQRPIANQLFNAAQQSGAGGSFGDTADYYRNNLSDNPTDFNAFAQPELRRFNEQIVPDLAEQFAGMGSGGLSSSGFRNAAIGAGTDLSERLAALRANLRQNSAQGLQNIGQFSLTPFQENIHRPETNGILGGFAEGAAKGFGEGAGKFLSGKFS